MIRPLSAGNSLQMLAEKNREPEQLKGTIRRINYSTAHIHVLVSGYGLLKRVKVSKGINVGTADRPSIFKGDKATIVRTQVGWKCIAVERKDRCDTRSSEFSDDVILENEVEPETGDSWTAQQLGSLDLPDDLHIPPFLPGGQLTLPAIRFPGGSTFLCGVPQCVDCQPNGISAGMSPVLSADATYPDGCWVWDFKVRGCQCGGSPALSTDYQIAAFTPVDVSNIRTVTDGDYTYAVWLETNGVTLKTFRIAVFDVSNPAAPTVAGSTTVSVPNLGISPTFTVALGGITKVFDTVWIVLSQRSYQTVLFGPSIDSSYLISIDVTTPATPTFIASTIDGSAGDRIGLFVPRAFSLGGNLYLVSQSANSTLGITMDLVVYDINNPLSAARIGQTTITSADTWYASNGAWQYVNGFVHFILRDQSPTQIDTYDITTPASPTFVGRFSLAIDNDGDGQAFLDAASNRIVYVATNDDATSNYVTKVDYTVPASPVVLDTFDAGVTADDDFRFIRVCGTTYFFTAQRGTASGSDTTIRAWPNMLVLPTGVLIPNFQGVDMQVNETHLYMGGFASPTDGKSHIAILDC